MTSSCHSWQQHSSCPLRPSLVGQVPNALVLGWETLRDAWRVLTWADTQITADFGSCSLLWLAEMKCHWRRHMMTLLSSQAFIWWESAWPLAKIPGLLTCLMYPWVTEMLLCNAWCSRMYGTQMLVHRAPNAWGTPTVLSWAFCLDSRPPVLWLNQFDVTTPLLLLPLPFPTSFLPLLEKTTVSPSPAAILWQCPTKPHYHPGPSGLYAYHFLQFQASPSINVID